jgi:transposase
MVAKVLALTCAEPPGETTHWTGRAMAKAVDLSLSTVQRIWEQHKLQPHRWRTFKRSNDPAFAEKVEDVVGLYMNPPAHAVVLSIDEKSQIQALDRTQPGLPLKPGKCGTMTHDYKRHGTTTLFVAFNVLDGAVLGRCMHKHTHQQFIRFLNAIEREVPAGKIVHAILDNYGTHKHPKVRAWLTRHPRWVFHFTPTSGSWLNAVENFFSALTRRRLRLSSTSRPPSTDTSTNTIPIQSPSSGPSPPTTSSPKSNACPYPPYDSVHWCTSGSVVLNGSYSPSPLTTTATFTAFELDQSDPLPDKNYLSTSVNIVDTIVGGLRWTPIVRQPEPFSKV